MSPNHDDAVKQSTLSTCYDATARAWKASPMKSIYLRYSWLLSMRSVFHITSAARIQRKGAVVVAVVGGARTRNVVVIVAGDVVDVVVDSKNLCSILGPGDLPTVIVSHKLWRPRINSMR